MANAKEEIIRQIEAARDRLNKSIDQREAYGIIYQCSVELDGLLNQYIMGAEGN